MKIRFNAIDTLFFKDAKPFSMGEETWAESLFPPPPSVLFGAIRTLYFIQNPDQFHLLNTADDPTRDLEIRAVYFNVNDSIYFPAPKDVVKLKDTEDFSVLDAIENATMTSYSLPYRLAPSNDLAAEDATGLATKGSMQQYIQSASWPVQGGVYPYAQLAPTEPKIGIGRNRQVNAASEGLLYRVGMKRMAFTDEVDYDIDQPSNHIRIEVEFEGLATGSFEKEGFLKIGGEGKAVHYSLIEEQGITFNWTPDSPYFKLYLMTPAIFKNGWLPSWLSWSEPHKTYIGTWNGFPLKLQTAAVGKPLPIGGFDMYHKQPKPLYKAVPAGSVYFFELKDESKIPELASLHLTSISEANEAYKGVKYDSRKQGFGRVLICNSPISI